MPKIKVKNIPTATRERICDKMYFCSSCPFCLKERVVIDEYTDIGCMVNCRYNPKETVVELSKKDFPTNREWLASLSNEDLATFLTIGIKIKNPDIYISFDSVRFTSHRGEVKKWLSQPCKSLMEEE